MAAESSLIFITGGVRSGKSSFAEQMALELAALSEGKLYYIATGVPFDSEMIERIKKHQDDRRNNQDNWITIEQSVSIGDVANHFYSNDILLLDCATTLLNNELYFAENKWDHFSLESIYEKVISGILAIKRRAKTLIVVSNEVLNEPINANALTFTYKKLLGNIHQRLVKEANQAYLVEAGIPIVMKER